MATELTTVATDMIDIDNDFLWFNDVSETPDGINKTSFASMLGQNLIDVRALADPGADRLMFWDDSAGAVTWLTLGTNLSITGTTLNASGGGGGITNSAGNNVIMKSDGTNAVASQLTDSGTDITQGGTGKFITPNAGFQVGTLSGSFGGRIFRDGSSYMGISIPHSSSGIFYLFNDAGTSVWNVTGAGKMTTTQEMEMAEMTAPAAPGANKVLIYAEDNGAGKTRLMARFNTGAAQQIAIEP